jgi:UPF0176 protein
MQTEIQSETHIHRQHQPIPETQPMMNISAYCFTELNNIHELRPVLKTQCEQLDLKGTILLSQEGINLFLSGTPENIADFKKYLLNTLVLPNIAFKDSPSGYKPFTRLLVRIKKEIISMGVPEIKPSDFTAPYMQAQELKNRLDAGEEIVILDTRNDYEYKTGKFNNAIKLPIRTFRAFPEAIKNLKQTNPELKNKTILTYCTGGIRCEKAASFMISEGFNDVYQLDGGILKYFEECGDAHYDGECFVFDKRVGVAPDLTETTTVQCFACRMPVSVDEQQTEQYKIGVHCPACYLKK